LNQTKGFWLLSNVLFAAFSISTRLKAKYQARVVVNPPLVCGEFDQELEILYAKMGLEVINVLNPF
jgi:hypothetical protein